MTCYKLKKYKIHKMYVLKNIGIDELNFVVEEVIAHFRNRSFLALFGDLGAGKTTFCQYLIRKILNDQDLIVLSPTFCLVQEYPLQHPISLVYQAEKIMHIDLYRIKNPDELLQTSLLEEMGSQLFFVEWAQNFGKYLPQNRIDISITHQKNDKRLFKIDLIG